jgi:hypothetical protein
METQKLKLKVGDHEFEAEGPIDVVQAQFAAWKELIASIPAKQPEKPAYLSASGATAPLAELLQPSPDSVLRLPFEKIMKTEGRIVSLTARSETIEETVLLILLGQKEFRGNQEVTGSEIMDGLKQSGYMLKRVDHLMDKLSTDGHVITIGVHRSRRYRLSNTGLTKALGIAREVIATVP